MNKTQIQKRLDAAWTAYRETVEAIGAELHEQRVKPFCIERGAEFVAGMGGYSLWVASNDPTRDKKTYDDGTAKSDKKWHSLREVLDMEIDGMRGNCLGSLLCDFRRNKKTA